MTFGPSCGAKKRDGHPCGAPPIKGGKRCSQASPTGERHGLWQTRGSVSCGWRWPRQTGNG